MIDKHELIDKIEKLDKVYGDRLYIERDAVLALIKQLNIPEKVTIPQFVADWVEKSKTVAAGTLKGAYINAPEEVRIWWSGDNVANVQVFARAWLDGYEIEQEKRYQVSIAATAQCLGKYYINNEILSPKFIYTGRNADYFTRKELEEAGFAWVFDCPGIEVEEVQDDSEI